MEYLAKEALQDNGPSRMVRARTFTLADTNGKDECARKRLRKLSMKNPETPLDQDGDMTASKMAFVLLFVFLYSVNAYAELPDNFRDVTFGKPPPKFLKHVDKDGFVDTYLKPGEVMALNNVKTSAINYYFYKNKFYMVYVQASGEVSRDMLKQLVAWFGAPKEEAKDGSCLWLSGDLTAIFKPAVLEESTGNNTCGFVLYKSSYRNELDASQATK